MAEPSNAARKLAAYGMLGYLTTLDEEIERRQERERQAIGEGLFTADDVDAAHAVWDGGEVKCPHADPSWYVTECDRCRIVRMVEAVAPPVAARALRKAKVEIRQATHEGRITYVRDVEALLDAFADQIEAQ